MLHWEEPYPRYTGRRQGYTLRPVERFFHPASKLHQLVHHAGRIDLPLGTPLTSFTLQDLSGTRGPHLYPSRMDRQRGLFRHWRPFAPQTAVSGENGRSTLNTTSSTCFLDAIQ